MMSGGQTPGFVTGTGSSQSQRDGAPVGSGGGGISSQVSQPPHGHCVGTQHIGGPQTKTRDVPRPPPRASQAGASLRLHTRRGSLFADDHHLKDIFVA